ncbi:MAG: hypothetical protein WBQ75_04590 [Acetobacteraceae bacterium]
MLGGQQDIVDRIKVTLPSGWFPDSTPVLDALLGGLAAAWSWSYGLLQYVGTQTRLATTSDVWLDIAAQDFLGDRITRAGQSDSVFGSRLRAEILRSRGTRASLSSVLSDLTGRQPSIFEPTRPSDTGSWGGGGSFITGLAYGRAGGWGSLALPFQCFLTAYRPTGSGIAMIAGWSTPAGGYGVGAIEYGDLSMVGVTVADADIFSATASVMPVATVAWTRISN